VSGSVEGEQLVATVTVQGLSNKEEKGKKREKKRRRTSNKHKKGIQQ
jgi:hypothetical protein